MLFHGCVEITSQIITSKITVMSRLDRRLVLTRGTVYSLFRTGMMHNDNRYSSIRDNGVWDSSANSDVCLASSRCQDFSYVMFTSYAGEPVNPNRCPVDIQVVRRCTENMQEFPLSLGQVCRRDNEHAAEERM